MSFPFLSRAHHDDVVAALKAQVAERDARLAALELAHHKLLDQIFEKTYGTRPYGTAPDQIQGQAEDEPEVRETETEQVEREFREAHDEDVRRVKSAMRTSPSQVPRLLEEIRAREIATSLTTAKVPG